MSRVSTGRRAARGEYIETDSGNKISRKAHITGTTNITLGGRTVIQADVQLRGDLHRLPTTTSSKDTSSSTTKSKPSKDDNKQQTSTTAIQIGRSSIISTGAIIKPPSRIVRGVLTYMPVRIGDNVFIGPNSHVSAASISNHVHVGHDVVIGPFSIIKESCKILPYTVMPSHMVVPHGSVVAGRPGRVIGEIGDGWGVSVASAGGGGGGSAASGPGWVEGGELRELVRAIK